MFAIDFKKAFDSVCHDFIIASLQYFGFGPIMMNIARKILSGRVGSVGAGDCFSFSQGRIRVLL